MTKTFPLRGPSRTSSVRSSGSRVPSSVKASSKKPFPFGVDGMKTKTKKSMKKKLGLTVGQLFGRMLKEAVFFEYMAYGPDENPWNLEFIGFTQIDDYHFSVGDKLVAVEGILTCPANHPVVVKGDTAEVNIDDYTYLFRFYLEPKRIESL